jgi:hypothetical protein
VLLHPRTNQTDVEVVKVEEIDAEKDEANEGTSDMSDMSDTEERVQKRRKTGVDVRVDVEAETSDGGFKGSSRWDDELKLRVHEIKVIRTCRYRSFPRY